jgi:troponin I
VTRLEEEKYDWEARLGRQAEEMNELNIKVNDVKGKFSKPVLKKVNRAQTKMAKFDKESMKKTKLAVTTLKSTGKDKFAVEEKEEEKKPDWGADSLQKHTKEAEPAAEEAQEAEEEEEEEEEE